MDAKYFPLEDNTPYTDRKRARGDRAPLDDKTLVAIQCMDCAGKRPHEILEVLAHHEGVTMERIMSLLDPADEQADTRKVRRQKFAEVGFASFKGRR
jgi:hypothetical protein